MRFQASDIIVLVGQAGRLSHQYLSEIVAYLIAHSYMATGGILDSADVTRLNEYWYYNQEMMYVQESCPLRLHGAESSCRTTTS